MGKLRQPEVELWYQVVAIAYETVMQTYNNETLCNSATDVTFTDLQTVNNLLIMAKCTSLFLFSDSLSLLDSLELDVAKYTSPLCHMNESSSMWSNEEVEIPKQPVLLIDITHPCHSRIIVYNRFTNDWITPSQWLKQLSIDIGCSVWCAPIV